MTCSWYFRLNVGIRVCIFYFGFMVCLLDDAQRFRSLTPTCSLDRCKWDPSSLNARVMDVKLVNPRVRILNCFQL